MAAVQPWSIVTIVIRTISNLCTNNMQGVVEKLRRSEEVVAAKLYENDSRKEQQVDFGSHGALNYQ
jgi:hypothetical protein